ncbi:hypothetical protein P3736_24295 [Vibrio parahaemolyticus]|nr:hypothetical protein [Vibrio parahaemolyticus]
MGNVEDYLKEYSNEIVTLTRTYFIWKCINTMASKDEEILKSMNHTPSTWNAILHSLQTTMFISLGRIFDIDDEAFSIHKFVKFCADNFEQFGRCELRKRKMAGHEEPPKWLEGYLNTAHFPKKEEFLRLRGEVAKKCKVYESTYKPIRHKLMAHKDFSAIGSADSLFSKTNITELEEIISFCNQIKLVIRQQYDNGRKMNLSSEMAFDDEDSMAEKEVKKILNAIGNKA